MASVLAPPGRLRPRRRPAARPASRGSVETFRPLAILRSAPWPVWILTALFGCLMAAYSVIVPLFHGTDEPNHFDMVLQLRHDTLTWPLTSDSRVSDQGLGAIGASPFGTPTRPFGLNVHALRAQDVGPASDRPQLAALHGPPELHNVIINQIPQHPPLFYLIDATLLRALPGSQHWRWDHVLGLLRLVGVAMVTPLPLLTWAAADRILGRRDLAVAASVIPLGIPTLTHIGGTVNNDDLLVLFGAVLAVALAYVHRGDLTIRTAAWVGGGLGLALFTKGLALALIPWVAVTYAVAWRRYRSRSVPSVVGVPASRVPPDAGDGAHAGAGAESETPATNEVGRPRPWRLAMVIVVATMLAGGWWLLVNVARYGTLQPSTPGYRQDFPLGHGHPGLGAFLWYGVRLMPWRWWGSFGFQEVHLPPEPVTAASFVLLAAILVELIFAPRGRGRRGDLAFLLAPIVLLAIMVVGPMAVSYLRTGSVAGLHGRYLYAAMAPTCVAVVTGAQRLPARATRWLPLAILAAAGALQLKALDLLVHHFWIPRGSGARDAWQNLTAFAPWPSWVVAALFVVTIAAALAALAALVALVARGSRRAAA